AENLRAAYGASRRGARRPASWAAKLELSLGNAPLCPGLAVAVVIHRAHFLRGHGVAELAEGFMLDLADALAGQPDALADFFQRHGLFAIKSVAHLEDLGLAVFDLIEQFAKLPELVVIADD